MDTLNDLFADILFDAGIKSLILAGSIWLCLKVTSRVSAARRHLAGAAGMFALILLPAFSLIAPKWEHTAPWTLPSAWTASDNNAAPKQITMAAPVSESVASNAAAKASTPAPGAVVAPVVADESTGTIQVDRRTWVLGLWGLVTACLILPLVVGWFRVRTWIGRASGKPAAEILELFEACRRRLKLRRQVGLIVSDSIRGPMTWGVLRCVVLLPEDFGSWPRKWQESA